MSVDLTKLVLYTGKPAFKNNDIATGSFVIGGSYSGGVNIRTFNVSLSVTPDVADISFSASSLATDAGAAPSNGWIESGYVNVPASGSTGTMPFVISPQLTGSTLTFNCYGVTTVDETGSLTNTTVSWRLVDYSSL